MQSLWTFKRKKKRKRKFFLHHERVYLTENGSYIVTGKDAPPLATKMKKIINNIGVDHSAT